MKILFLYLKAFSANGGIEKVCRLAGKAVYEYGEKSKAGFTMYSRDDKRHLKTEHYLPATVFKGFAGYKERFFIKSVR